MTPLLCCLSETLYLYVQAYSLFVCQVAERPLFAGRSHTWHQGLLWDLWTAPKTLNLPYKISCIWGSSEIPLLSLLDTMISSPEEQIISHLFHIILWYRQQQWGKVRRQSRGEMQQWTNIEHKRYLDWSLQSSGNHNLSWWVLNSTNKLTDDRLIGLELLSSTNIPSSPSHHSAALSDCRIDLTTSCSNLQSLKSVSQGFKCIMHPSKGY